MSKIFTRTFRVRWAELDASGTVSPANYLRYLIETAWDWGDAVGLGVNDSQTLNLFWVIRETEIRFLRPLCHNDVFDFTIWLVNWQRVRGTRCFELTLKESGDVIAQGTQQVVCMDVKTGRPVSLPENVIDRFRLENPRAFPFERFPKITPAETAPITQRQVELMDLDVYEHVNNAVYVDYAQEAAAQAFSAQGWSPARLAEANLRIATRRMQIQYLSLAAWGETLNISTYPLKVKDTGGSRYIGIARTDGSPVAECILDWELVDRTNGEVRPLPDKLR
ncbi:MAG TPA: acyl-CoA thioesterase [Anaerolineales bacterium]|nr:acyl-CoA thioesterase [Anaerolineales bacterium]HLO31606.1 acyl-CoA thioesterase [Anaerolineales bacterium]